MSAEYLFLVYYCFQIDSELERQLVVKDISWRDCFVGTLLNQIYVLMTVLCDMSVIVESRVNAYG